jgi:hypothetical protein
MYRGSSAVVLFWRRADTYSEKLTPRSFTPLKFHSVKESSDMEVFVVNEPLYDVCESWAEEPEPEAWAAFYFEALAWLIRPN